jgi:hypothetical protein
MVTWYECGIKGDVYTTTRLSPGCRTPQRLAIPKSRVVREAVEEYHARIGKLSEAERLRMLDAFDRLVAVIPDRPVADVDKELAYIRKSRRTGGRKSRQR